MALFDYTKRLLVGSIYFSLLGSMSEIVPVIQRELNCNSFSERYLTDYENKIIRIDDITSSLDITLEEIICSRAFCFEVLDFCGNNLKLFATKYFVVAVFEGTSEDSDLQNLQESIERISEIFQKVVVRDYINIRRNFVVLEDHFITEKEAIMDVLSSIQMDNINVPFVNRRYAETVRREQYVVDVVRNIMSGFEENADEVPLECFNIFFMTRCYDDNVSKDCDLKKNFNAMLTHGTDFASVFFK